MVPKILAVEDAKDSQLLLRAALEPDYEVVFKSSAAEVVGFAVEESPDLILLDIGFSDSDGFKACEELRADPRTRDIPILFVTAKAEPTEIQKGFDLGADDYITKPFHPVELLARCKSRLKKAATVAKRNEVSFGELTLDVLKRAVQVDSQLEQKQFKLSPAEFQLLLFLCRNQGTAFSREQIRAGAAFGDTKEVDTRVIDTQVSSLRRKSKFLSEAIQSVYGVGYRLNLDFESVANA